jgi:thymidylate synthase (FAD)
LREALKRGHESVAEHATFTFLIEGISRVTLAQLTRHRLASFSVQSQRYRGADADIVVFPESYAAHVYRDSVDDLLMQAAELYNEMVYDGVATEDARYILPQGITTTLMMTANARELRHFFSLRCCNRAQWEIRQLADEMLKLCKGVAPVLFADAGAGCVRGRCPEGSKSCGKPRGAE